MIRYRNLLIAIELFQPKTIVEVGTWNGRNACRMIKQASKSGEEITYLGYDLFEEATEQTDAEEFNVKEHNTLESVAKLLKTECANTNIILTKGNTRETLKPMRADFAFIDGGHSIETIQSDYDALKDSSIIILDDYYVPDESGKCPDITKMGCNKLLEGVKNYVLLPGRDPVAGGGYTQLAMIVNK